MRKLSILGCGNAVPDNFIMFGEEKRYRMTEGQNLLELCEVAINRALEDAGLTIDDIDCIIGGMATPLQPGSFHAPKRFAYMFSLCPFWQKASVHYGNGQIQIGGKCYPQKVRNLKPRRNRFHPFEFYYHC